MASKWSKKRNNFECLTWNVKIFRWPASSNVSIWIRFCAKYLDVLKIFLARLQIPKQSPSRFLWNIMFSSISCDFDFKDVILMICFAFAVVGTKQQFTLAQHLSPILKISIKMWYFQPFTFHFDVFSDDILMNALFAFAFVREKLILIMEIPGFWKSKTTLWHF